MKPLLSATLPVEYMQCKTLLVTVAKATYHNYHYLIDSALSLVKKRSDTKSIDQHTTKGVTCLEKEQKSSFLRSISFLVEELRMSEK